MEIIVGTAGHIDHGKTALVKALTGVDADRLPEEKRRGITIDLGFAGLDLDGVHIGFVDVPGHEKFVKNMLAGAHGIDLVALIIAANEGVMPQTLEHFDICRLLETKAGIVVITKADLVDEELLELVKLDAAELVKDSFLENSPVVCVSAKTGAGIDELRKVLRDSALKIPPRKNESIARLPIDRIFLVKGFGTVVTGTLVSGAIATGDEMEFFPAEKRVRVRNVQVHEKPVERAFAGQRAAINLAGVDLAGIERGMIIAPPGTMRPTQSIDVEIEVLPDAARPLRSRQRVRVHLGTAEILARLNVIGETGEIAPGERGFAQLRLESAVAAVAGERFVIRSYSPQQTIAGGSVLDNLAVRHRRRDFPVVQNWLVQVSASLKDRDRSKQIFLLLQNSFNYGLSKKDIQARTGFLDEIITHALTELVSENSAVEAREIFLAREHFEKLSSDALSEIDAHHKREPLSQGISRETLKEKLFAHLPDDVFGKVLGELENSKKIASDKDLVRLAGHGLSLRAVDETLRQAILQIYMAAGLEVPNTDDVLKTTAAEAGVSAEHARKILQLLLRSGEIIGVTKELQFHKDSLDRVIGNIREHAGKTPGRLLDITAFKELTGASRKYAIPLLEYFDRSGITRRSGNGRIVL